MCGRPGRNDRGVRLSARRGRSTPRTRLRRELDPEIVHCLVNGWPVAHAQTPRGFYRDSRRRIVCCKADSPDRRGRPGWASFADCSPNCSHSADNGAARGVTKPPEVGTFSPLSRTKPPRDDTRHHEPPGILSPETRVRIPVAVPRTRIAMRVSPFEEHRWDSTRDNGGLLMARRQNSWAPMRWAREMAVAHELSKPEGAVLLLYSTYVKSSGSARWATGGSLAKLVTAWRL
jgi:hypothetical protein